MPVILENGSDALRTWLDPNRSTWTKELQSLLKPYEGELEVYAVSKEVGKVGNNSPTFVVPVASLENKGNIRNFFKGGGKREKEEGEGVKEGGVKREPEEEEEEEEQDVKKENQNMDIKNESPGPSDDTTPETNAPALPPTTPSRKRKQSPPTTTTPAKKSQKLSSPAKASPSARKPRSATSNNTAGRKSTRDSGARGSMKITSFFG